MSASRYTGEIRIEPPLTQTEVVGCPFLMVSEIGYPHSVHIEVTPDADGAPAETVIVPVKEDPYKGYDVQENIQAIVDRYRRPGRTFIGHLHAEGEENDDIRRYVVRGVRAVEVRAVIAWPDEIRDLAAAADRAEAAMDGAAIGDPEATEAELGAFGDLLGAVRAFTRQIGQEGPGQ